ncbi:helix-turn-helix transcriptional regulator [Kocuria sp. CNJ-770]|uniref:helix-turn-helix transcriptional regulator n=1 Tax=Kocuria sp. CNJ-770 TaxID=1904964 RepID=UPI000AFCBB02
MTRSAAPGAPAPDPPDLDAPDLDAPAPVPPRDDGPRDGRTRRPAPAGAVVRPPWTFLTNHGHVLLAVAQSQDARVSEIAARVGITTRATLAILKDLESAGYLRRHRTGRRSHYTVDGHRPFRHPAIAAHEIGELLDVLAPAPAGAQDVS